MKRMESVTTLIIRQAVESLKDCLLARKKLDVERECDTAVNVHILLGVALEGIINDIGSTTVEAWVWAEIEKLNPPAKWKLIGKFEVGKKTLNTVIEIQKLRNKLVHPKLYDMGDIAIAVDITGKYYKISKDEDILPGPDFTLYDKYYYFFEQLNAYSSLLNTKNALEAIKELNDKFNFYPQEWIEAFLVEVKALSVNEIKWEKVEIATVVPPPQ